MGAWAYCRACECGFDKPTIVEAFEGEQQCPRCGTRRDLDADDRRMACEEIVERLEKVEAFEARIERVERLGRWR